MGGDNGAVAVFRPGEVPGEAGIVFGTTPRATGREFGSGGFAFADLSEGLPSAGFAPGLSGAGLAAEVARLTAGFSTACLGMGFTAAGTVAGPSGLSA